jgi:hypothetical protein
MSFHLQLVRGVVPCESITPECSSRPHYENALDARLVYHAHCNLIFTETVRELSACQDYLGDPINLETLAVEQIHDDEGSLVAEVSYASLSGVVDAIFLSADDEWHDFAYALAYYELVVLPL